MANFSVTNLSDMGLGSLRQAILDANSASGADRIDFNANLSGGTINLSSGELLISDALSINGLGANLLRVNGGNQGFRVFNIDNNDADSFIDVAINGLTITGGQATGNFPNNSGGGILNQENLTLSNSIVSGNTATFNGGGIENYYRSTLTLSNSTVLGNTAFVGGGIMGRSPRTSTT